MVQKVAVDRNLCAIDRKGRDAQPFVINVVGWFPRCPFAQENNIGDDARPFAFEGVRGEPNRSQEIGAIAQILALTRISATSERASYRPVSRSLMIS